MKFCKEMDFSSAVLICRNSYCINPGLGDMVGIGVGVGLAKCLSFTVKILKFGTPQTIAIIVLKVEKFDVTLN